MHTANYRKISFTFNSMEDEVNRDSKEKFTEGSGFLGGIRPLQLQRRKAQIVVGFVLVAVVFFLIGILIGYLVTKTSNSESCSRQGADNDDKRTGDFQKFHDLFKQTIRTEKLESLMRYDKLVIIDLANGLSESSHSAKRVQCSDLMHLKHLLFVNFFVICNSC